MQISLHTNCCKKGKEYLTYIPKEDCAVLDIDPPRNGFYLDVSGSYPDPAWELIHWCPFCGSPLAVPIPLRGTS